MGFIIMDRNEYIILSCDRGLKCQADEVGLSKIILGLSVLPTEYQNYNMTTTLKQNEQEVLIHWIFQYSDRKDAVKEINAALIMQRWRYHLPSLPLCMLLSYFELVFLLSKNIHVRIWLWFFNLLSHLLWYLPLVVNESPLDIFHSKISVKKHYWHSSDTFI